MIETTALDGVLIVTPQRRLSGLGRAAAQFAAGLAGEPA
jgi:hypothetical protein